MRTDFDSFQVAPNATVQFIYPETAVRRKVIGLDLFGPTVPGKELTIFCYVCLCTADSCSVSITLAGHCAMPY